MIDVTTPTIGQGVSKICRDVCLDGYAVGMTQSDPSRPPELIDYSAAHVLCYDIETEYAGSAYCQYDAPILCIGMVCSCGWKMCVSRRPLAGQDIDHIVRTTNIEIAEITIQTICSHRPIFTIGHNIYGFDNKVLAQALGSSHPLSAYFKQLMRSDASTSTDFGLIMTIPGINNLDTYRFIRESMFGEYKLFGLGPLCEANGIASPKTTHHRTFSSRWFEQTGVNATTMAVYNLGDCIANLELCKRLDLVNQVVSLCYASRAWIQDVMLYNTGAIATSCLCTAAYIRGYDFAWNRCDWRPESFRGGELIYTGPCVASNIMSVDFVSMYPTIMSSCGISPESIDYVSPSDVSSRQFRQIGVRAIWEMSRTDCLISCVIYGIVDGQRNVPESALIIGEFTIISELDRSESLSNDSITRTCRRRAYGMMSRDRSLVNVNIVEYDVEKAMNAHKLSSRHRSLNERVTDVHTSLKETRIATEWIWIPLFKEQDGYAIDWISASPGYSSVVRAPEYEAHFTHGTRIASSACRVLMESRGVYKRLMKDTKTSDPVRSKAFDKLQYALKISANSMYGSLSFAPYNTYSPRCGMSVTAIGRWSLMLSAVVVAKMGFNVIYGDTDSVMFCLPYRSIDYGNPINTGNERPIAIYLVSLMNDLTVKDLGAVCEYICDSKGATVLTGRQHNHLRGLVPKILRHIMSYTCVAELNAEHASTGCILKYGIESRTYKRLIVMQKKHYIGMHHDGSRDSKGVSYVRRTGADLKDKALMMYSNVVLKYESLGEKVRHLRLQHRRLLNMIDQGTPLSLFHLYVSVMGNRGCYIKVLHPNVKYVPAKDPSLGSYTIDSGYYRKIVEDVLTTICSSIGLPDSDIIRSHVSLMIHGI